MRLAPHSPVADIPAMLLKRDSNRTNDTTQTDTNIIRSTHSHDVSAPPPYSPPDPRQFNGSSRQFIGHTGQVYAVAFSPDGKYIASGGGDTTIRLWDAKTGNMVAGPLKSRGIHALAFSSDGKRMVSGSQVIQVWNVESPYAVPAVFGLENHRFLGGPASIIDALPGHFRCKPPVPLPSPQHSQNLSSQPSTHLRPPPTLSTPPTHPVTSSLSRSRLTVSASSRVQKMAQSTFGIAQQGT